MIFGDLEVYSQQCEWLENQPKLILLKPFRELNKIYKKIWNKKKNFKNQILLKI